MHHFKAEIKIIGINPFVFVPEKILNAIFKEANKQKGPIPIRGTINGETFQQTLIRYQGEWRLYINTSMLKKSPDRIGEIVKISVGFDPADRSIEPHPKLKSALLNNAAARQAYDGLPASLQKEIVRYIARLKTEASVEQNVQKAIQYLLGKGRFVGRGNPRNGNLR